MKFFSCFSSSKSKAAQKAEQAQAPEVAQAPVRPPLQAESAGLMASPPIAASRPK